MDNNTNSLDIVGLTLRLEGLERRVTTLEQARGNTENVRYPAGTIQSGKYAGKTHEYVVQTEPSYVVFLDANGHAARFGFSTADVMACEDYVAKHPEPKRTR